MSVCKSSLKRQHSAYPTWAWEVRQGYTLLTDTRKQAACMERRLLWEKQLFLILLPTTAGTESPFSGNRTCWLPASWFPFAPMKEELNHGSGPFSQPFLSQIAQRQVIQVVLLVRWRRKQASPYRWSKEPVLLWMERVKGGPKGGRCTRQGTQAPQSLVHNTKSCSHSLPHKSLLLSQVSPPAGPCAPQPQCTWPCHELLTPLVSSGICELTYLHILIKTLEKLAHLLKWTDIGFRYLKSGFKNQKKILPCLFQKQTHQASSSPSSFLTSLPFSTIYNIKQVPFSPAPAGSLHFNSRNFNISWPPPGHNCFWNGKHENSIEKVDWTTSELSLF